MADLVIPAVWLVINYISLVVGVVEGTSYRTLTILIFVHTAFWQATDSHTDTNEWTEVQQQERTPSPRAWHTAVVYGKQIVIFGGFSQSGALSDVHIFDTGMTTLLFYLHVHYNTIVYVWHSFH